MANFEAFDDFRESLLEVDILCEAAESALADSRKYSTFNKAALLLIAGKFEAFAESLIEEFVFRINEHQLPCHKIPDALRLHHTFRALGKLETVRQKHKHPEALQLFNELGKVWAPQASFIEIEIESSFSFGQHGEAQLVKLFEKIGVEDVLNVVSLVDQMETVSADTTVPTPVDFRGIFNSVTNMRNNILHEDASPSLNTVQVKRYRIYFEEFARKLGNHLEDILASISKADQSLTERSLLVPTTSGRSDSAVIEIAPAEPGL
jgi:hypothetical protein